MKSHVPLPAKAKPAFSSTPRACMHQPNRELGNHGPVLSERDTSGWPKELQPGFHARLSAREPPSTSSRTMFRREQIPVRRIDSGVPVIPASDSFEKNADSVADQVLHMAEAETYRDYAFWRNPACSAPKVTRAPVFPHALRSAGSPLDTETRAFFEPRFGHDFSQVRVHSNGSAIDSAMEMDTDAYTTGSHIVFAKEQYAPNSAQGRRLLAHELAHVVQQQHSSHAPNFQARRIRRSYSTAADETGPVWDVTLIVTEAPERNTEELFQFMSACERGILDAIRDVGTADNAQLRVVVRFRGGSQYSDISQEAYQLARQHVLGGSEGTAPAGESRVPEPAIQEGQGGTTSPTTGDAHLIVASAASVSWIDPASPAGDLMPDSPPAATVTAAFLTGDSGFRFSNYLHAWCNTGDMTHLAGHGVYADSGLYRSISALDIPSHAYPTSRNETRFTEGGIEGVEIEQLAGARTITAGVAGGVAGAVVGVGAGAVAGAKGGAVIGSLGGPIGAGAGAAIGGVAGGLIGWGVGSSVANRITNFPPIWTRIRLRLKADGSRRCVLVRHSHFPSNNFYCDFSQVSNYSALAAEQSTWEAEGWDSGNPWGASRPTVTP